MKLMVSTKLTQGQSKDDFCFVPDGEIVEFGSVCCNSEKCGCNRGMCGTICHTGTTTMLIEDVQVDRETLVGILMNSLVSAGWAKFMTPEEADQRVNEDADELIRIGSFFPLGAIVTQKNGKFTVRNPRNAN